MAAFAAGIFAIGLTAFSIASFADEPLCDNGIWTQMTERARLNGQMDQAKAENLVFKADSILEYSCFERFVDTAPANASYYMTYAGPNSLLKPTIENYLFTNFGHTFMGGRALAGQPNLPSANAPYDCSAMYYVWSLAKCMNATERAPEDNMIGLFEFIAAPDSRTLPSACTAPSAAAFGSVPVVLPPPIAITALLPAPDCGTPVPTGSIVDLSSTDTSKHRYFPPIAGGRFNEKICTNPACTYVPTGFDTGNCVAP